MHVDDLALLEDLFEKYKKDPGSIDSSWKLFFDHFVEGEKTQPLQESAKEYLLQDAYRRHGHLVADFIPLGKKRPFPKELDLNIQHPLIQKLERLYCGKIGYEFMHTRPEVAKWVQNQIETQSVALSEEEKKDLFASLSKAEILESFLHTKYMGQKRFSLEGEETLIPMMQLLLEKGSLMGMEECIIGMPHRGRLNVLVNILNKSYERMFHEFEDSSAEENFVGSGDVKYHKGFFSTVTLRNGKQVYLAVAPNPSHLESVDPVVEGEAKARQIAKGEGDQNKVLALLIHGDAALSGQGVVYETLQLSQLKGYGTGGTIHIVLNNQIGFTTLPKEYKSTSYCTDIAKIFGAPIFHVNAEDPEGCIYAVHLALQIRFQFHLDVFIELNGYRKYGHNETDEPAFTQPIEYQEIKAKKAIPQIYAEKLQNEGISVEAPHIKEELQAILEETKKKRTEPLEAKEEPFVFEKVETGVPLEQLVQMAKRFCLPPEGFHLHKKVQKLFEERLKMLESKIDWGMAEYLALASLLWEGIHVRLSGQDCRRGTFSHRHAMWVDQEKEDQKYFPLSHLKEGQGQFDVFNSPLSEFAILGFEYGYSLAASHALVIWEAQFGDFSNEAQVIIDQYLASAEQKWAQTSRLTLFLPHGYEGQGPEHSSARLERFLQLAGRDNMILANPTTPAQFFHLLRRQVLQKVAKPLIIFTPKGLLRYPECVSPIQDFTQGSFEEVLFEEVKDPKKVLLCSGRIYFDLVKERKADVAIVRLEQIYPLDIQRLKEICAAYQAPLFWVQEEPQNMGAWSFMQAHLPELGYVGRKKAASPAVGSHTLHEQELKAILKEIWP